MCFASSAGWTDCKTSFLPFSSIFPRFLPLFSFFKVSGHVEVGSSSKEPAFDLFARVGRKGGVEIDVEGLEIDVLLNKKRTPPKKGPKT